MAYVSAAELNWWSVPGDPTGGAARRRLPPPQTTGNPGGKIAKQRGWPTQSRSGTGGIIHSISEVEDRTPLASRSGRANQTGENWVITFPDERAMQIETTNHDRIALINRAFDFQHTFTTPESERLRILNQRIAALVPGITAEETSELESITEFLEQVQSGRLRRQEKFGTK